MRKDRPDAIDALLEAIPDTLSDRERLVVELAKRIGLLQGALHRAVQAELNELGMTYAEFEVLAALRRAGPPYRRKPNALARDLVITSGGVSNVLQRLESSGLVERLPDDTDARSRWVGLTREGVQRAARATRLATAAHAEVLRSVSDEDARTAADALRNVSNSL